MKKTILSSIILLMMLCMQSTMPAWALEFEVDGYNYIVVSSNSVSVCGNENQSITELNIPEEVVYNNQIYRVSKIEHDAFSDFNKVSKIVIPNSVKSVGSLAFARCTATDLIIGDSVDIISSEAFRGCAQLKEIRIPASVERVESGAFEYCTGATALIIEDSDTPIYFDSYCSGSTIDYKYSNYGALFNVSFSYIYCGRNVKFSEDFVQLVFYIYGSRVKTLKFGDNVTEIEPLTFYGLSNLTELNLPENIKTIGAYAFKNSSVKKAVIPASVENIGESPFPENSLLYFESANPASIKINKFLSSYTLVVDEINYDKYKSVWSEYSDQIIPSNIWNAQVEITANSNLSALHRALGEDNLSKVGYLKITGSMNSYDLMIIRNKMINLRQLDLSDCQIVGNKYEFYTGYCTQDDTIPDYAFCDLGLSTITLPKKLKHVGSFAFANSSLESVTMPEQLNSIGYSAFLNCCFLKGVKMPQSLESMEDNVFEGCSSLDSITIPDGVKSLPEATFLNCYSLKYVKLSNSLNSIGHHCFEECSALDTVNVPDNVTEIGYGAFYDCYAMKQIHLSKRLTTILDYAFYECSSLKSVSITSMIESIGNQAFAGCNALDTVYTYTIEPTSINQETFSKTAFQNATLMVPRTSYYVYFYNTQWSQFLKLKEFDQPYEFVYLNNDYTLDGTTGIISGSPIVYINPTGALITESGIVQNSDEIVLRYNGSKFGTVMATDNVNANRLTLELTLRANRWYYLCFPCDVKRSELTVPGDYVIYTYNGETRAKNGSGGWQKLGDTESLKRGQGYILQCNTAGTLTASVEKPDLKGQDYEQTLTAYESDDAHNANWNFVGNPFTAYMPIQKMSSKSPITVWNASTKNYEAYSTQDDAYVLEPCQCFFVQKTTSETGITFQADGRMSYTGSQNYSLEAPAMRGVAVAENPRRVINLTLTGNETSDKTRVVLNEEAQLAYEMECDASKFMGSNAVQLYTIYNNVKYAINERPVDNHEVALGYMASAEGSYTIAKSDKQAGISLCDKQTGITTDLSKGGYSFETKAGTFDDRFVLKFAEVSTEIQQMEQPEAEGIYYNAAGICMGSDRESLPAGTYLYKAGETTNKVVIK